MIENIRLSFQGIWSHKMRSFLTMLGIIIGIAAIIAIVSTIKGTNEQIKENLIGSGDNTVTVSLYQGDWEYDMSAGVPDGVPAISEEMLDSIKDTDKVEDVSAFYKRQDYDNIFYKNVSLAGGYLYGIEQNYLDTCDFILREGRGFDKEDYKKQRKVALLDSDSEQTLFQGESAVGKTIEISSIPFTVVGIVDEDSKFEPVINSIDEYYTYYSDSSASRIFVPSSMWPALYSFDEPQNVAVRATSTDTMTDAGKAVADYLTSHQIIASKATGDNSYSYRSDDLLKQAQQLQEMSSATNNQLIWIASISLLVGGVGVMNIMLVTVTERTAEIGLKKAIGAKRRRILAQFLTEASVLTGIGGLLGVLGGIGMSQLISKFMDTPTALSVPAILVAVVFSVLIGLIFGLVPAVKASKLNPIEALRRE